MSSRELVGKSASTHDYLKQCAIKGRLRPGQHLTPVEIAEQLRVSITPIRDALARLTQEGFLTWKASQGYFTKAFTVVEQRDLFQLIRLGLLPCLDLGDAAEVARVLERFVALADDPWVAGAGTAEADADAFARAIEALYLQVSKATGNLTLLGQVENQLERTHLVRRLDFRDPKARLSSALSVRRSASALLRRDLISAITEAKTQLAELSERLPGLVAMANSMALQSNFP